MVRQTPIIIMSKTWGGGESTHFDMCITSDLLIDRALFEHRMIVSIFGSLMHEALINSGKYCNVGF